MNSFFGKSFLYLAGVFCLPFALFAEDATRDGISIGSGIERHSHGIDLSVPPTDSTHESAGSPAVQKEEKTSEAVPAKPIPHTFPEAHRKFIFECEPKEFSAESYEYSVENLLASYEKRTGRKLVPAATQKVALKIYTASGRGLETPKDLTRAVRTALEKRGFKRENIILADLSERNLRLAGYLPPFRRKNDFFWEGSPVIALDTGKHYHEKWFYENNLPTRESSTGTATEWEDIANERKSFLPIPLLFEVDFWINLPVACDSPALGVSAAIGNATLWNAGNQKRFLDNPANAVHMAVSIATIPELRAKFELSILSLEKYQFIGGPVFNENYTLSEKQIWLSANPVILDFLMWKRMNRARASRGFEPIFPEPPLFSTASKGEHSLGSCMASELELVRVPAE